MEEKKIINKQKNKANDKSKFKFDQKLKENLKNLIKQTILKKIPHTYLQKSTNPNLNSHYIKRVRKVLISSHLNFRLRPFAILLRSCSVETCI